MKEMTVRWTGIRPLIMHNADMIDPDNRTVLAIGQLTRSLKKLKKDDVEGKEDLRRKIERLEWEGSMYWQSDGVFMPGKNIMAAIVAGARKIKAGKQAEQAIVPIEDIPIDTKVSTKNLDKLYENKDFSLRQAVRIPPKTGSRIMKVRPKITDWSLTFKIEYDEKTLPTNDLLESMNEAGSLIGLCDWRPIFGRFIVEVVK